MTETLLGSVERITFYNPQNSFTVAKLACRGHSDFICVVGPLPAVQPGEAVRCQGKWHNHPQHGRQFLVCSAQVEMPADVVGIEKYLQSGLVRGIGPTYAKRIVQKFGAATLDVIDTSPEKLLDIPGIGQQRLTKVIACWQEQRAIRDVMVFLQTFGVSPAYGQRIFKIFDSESIAVVKDNPYRLAREVSGIGFKTADRIAQTMGLPSDSPKRIEAGIEYVLAFLSDMGHVCYPREQLLLTAAQTLDVTVDLVTERLTHLTTTGRTVEQRGLVWKKALYMTELGIAQELHRVMTNPRQLREIDTERALTWVQETLGLSLANQQLAAVRASLTKKVLVITGGPGTGKSTIIRAILAIIGKLTKNILLAAPTGRAAKRMTEITGWHAQTIHALLEWDFRIGAFTRRRSSPLTCNLLVVDEVSMLDSVLMHNLLKAIPSTATLILVGDIDQLPSVGPGNVLQDIIRSNTTPVVGLTEIFRQSRGSTIIINAHRIQRGTFPLLKPNPRSDFFFISRETPEEVQSTILELVTQRLPAKYCFDPLQDVQVLTPMKRGLIGTLQLNQTLQSALNPKGRPLLQFGREYREGDKVMQVKNNYEKRVYNGDIGKIVQIDFLEHQVHVRFDRQLVLYEFAELDDVQLAYAVSIHKSQGSEYRCVVIPIHTTHFTMLHRNLLYTGITRGKELVILVGTKKAIAIAIRNDEAHQRHSGLMNALLEIEQTPLLGHRHQH